MTERSSLYSDNGDEFESYSPEEEYSPTDGYFDNRDHPHDVFVQSPTTTHAKEMEAAEESQSQSQSRSRSAPSSSRNVIHEYRVPSSPTHSESNEETPLLYGVPPPAYSPRSPTAGTLPSSQDRVANITATALFPTQGPESMGAPPDHFDIERHGFVRPQRSWFSNVRSRMFKFASAALVIVMLLWIFMQVFVSKDDITGDRPSEDEPEMPSMPKWPTNCAFGSYREASFDFSALSSFAFDENIHSNEFNGRIYGRVRLTTAPSSQIAPIRVNISYSPSEPYSVDELHILKTNNAIILKDPRLRRDNSGYDSHRSPCIGVSATIYFREEVTLSKLYINTRNLDIEFSSDFKTTVDESFVRTESAKVRSEAKFNSRETRITAGSSSVSGSYNLLDLLSITTESGSIDVDVTPKEAAKENNPAKLQCQSRSGSITVNTPPQNFLSDLPERDYRTSISTKGGSVSGNYIHGTHTIIQSKSGSLSLQLLPYSGDDTSTLKTTSQSGMTQLHLLSPYTGKTIKNMTSTHTTGSGSLSLTYPQEWEGYISGATGSGSLTLRGKDVKTTQYANKKVQAHKGKGYLHGKLDFKSSSGSADVTVGDT